MYNLSDNAVLDNFVLAKELMNLADLSPNAFRYWKNCIAGKYYKSRIIYLHKEFIHKNYKHLIEECTPLNGLIQSAPFCRYTNLSLSHLTKSNNTKIYEILHIQIISGVKFVNLKKFLDMFELDYNHTIYIEKCKYFAPLEKKIKLTPLLCLGYY